MNKTKKSYLLIGSILTIVVSVFSILGGMFCFLIGSVCDEDFVKQIYIEDPEYQLVELPDEYYFEYMEDGNLMKITEDDIELVSDLIETITTAVGVVIIATAAVKLGLAIRIIIANSRNTYAKGSVITLLVLSIINGNILEIIFLALAMSTKDKEPENKPLGLNDIPAEKDINQ